MDRRASVHAGGGGVHIYVLCMYRVCYSGLGIRWFLSVRHMVDGFTWQNVSAPKGLSSVAKRVQNKSSCISPVIPCTSSC